MGAGVRRFKRADAQDPRALGLDWAFRLEVIAAALALDVSLDRKGATMDLARERQECLKPSLPPRLRRRGWRTSARSKSGLTWLSLLTTQLEDGCS